MARTAETEGREIKGNQEKKNTGRYELESWLDHLNRLGDKMTHREESLHLTVLVCKIRIVIILPFSMSWVIVKVKNEAFVGSGESMVVGYFSAQSCSSGCICGEESLPASPL